MRITDVFPLREDFVSAPVEKVGAAVVLISQAKTSTGDQIHARNLAIEFEESYRGAATTRPEEAEIIRASSEAIAWTIQRGLFVQRAGDDPGWLMLSRAGEAFTADNLDQIRLRDFLSIDLLHPEIARNCLDAFNAGHYQMAVFEAFKIVEIAVREGAGLDQTDHGRPMVMKAFHTENGALASQHEQYQEREALAMLMGGAVGYFKNPLSHRRTELDDPIETIELLMMATHLLRIVESRSPQGEPS